MAHYYVEPEVAGELGPNSVVDTSVHPPAVSHLEYRFTDWLGDSVLETFPCYIVTDELAKNIAEQGLSGVTFADVEVTLSPEAEELLNVQLPTWTWFKITGEPFNTDFGVSEDQRLVVSEKALEVLRQAGISHADVEEAE
jgi:hypothetical protein